MAQFERIVELTSSQKVLAEMLATTTTRARIRTVIQDPTPHLEESIELVAIIDVPHKTNIHMPTSDVYVSLRGLDPFILSLIGKEMNKAQKTATLCTGIPNAGEPIATVFSIHSTKSVSPLKNIMLLNKDESEEKVKFFPYHYAPLGEGETPIDLIDDVITTAGTKIKAAKVLEDIGYKVETVRVVIDRGQGGKEQLEKAGYPLVAALHLPSTLVYLAKRFPEKASGYLKAVDYLEANRFD